jgi:hypothetical protein
MSIREKQERWRRKRQNQGEEKNGITIKESKNK